jgi:hypothetical protein
MPLAAIRQYAALVGAGSGNEDARLTLLRQHQRRVAARITALTECLSLIQLQGQTVRGLPRPRPRRPTDHPHQSNRPTHHTTGTVKPAARPAEGAPAGRRMMSVQVIMRAVAVIQG